MLNSRFEWLSREGQYKLRLRDHEQPYPWLGKYSDRDNYFVLYPVEPGMLQPYLDFVLSELNWSPESIVLDENKDLFGTNHCSSKR